MLYNDVSFTVGCNSLILMLSRRISEVIMKVTPTKNPKMNTKVAMTE